jgi:single-stranded DNA-binding protein
MNNLNSTLLEGVASVPYFTQNGGFVCFSLTNNRFSTYDGQLRQQSLTVEVLVEDERLGEQVYSTIRKRRQVRVVGRLISDETGRARILAEHVEYGQLAATSAA